MDNKQSIFFNEPQQSSEAQLNLSRPRLGIKSYREVFVDRRASLRMMGRRLLAKEELKTIRSADRTYTIQTARGVVEVQFETLDALQ